MRKLLQLGGSGPWAFYFRCPDCWGPYGRGKGKYGLGRHDCRRDQKQYWAFLWKTEESKQVE